MKRRSLRLRLFLASALSIGVALAMSGFGLSALFERHVERWASAELDTYVHQLAANIVIDASGVVTLSRPLADPRFEQPFSGLYWQIQNTEGDMLVRSRSLWDHVLLLPSDTLQPGIMHSHDLPGPQGATLMVQEQLVIYSQPPGRHGMRIAVAMDRRNVEKAREQFAEDIYPALAMLALFLTAAAWAQVVIGLRPLEAVRKGVTAIRERRQPRLEGGFPDEVMPLVSEVNELLEAQESAIERARTRAGDLAHGLRTPLTVLAGDVRKLRERGEEEIADEIEELAHNMRRHIDRELARTRTAQQAVRGQLSAELGPLIDRLVAAMRRTPRGEKLAWNLDIAENLRAAADAGDLAEVAGNLIDNAMKWAKTRICVTVRRDGGNVTLIVRDDGEGVPDAMLAALGRRGERLDEQTPGTGLGLAIAREILETYGGGLEIANHPEGGLSATVRLPAAD